MLKTLKVSILNCNSQSSRIGKLLNNERSVLKTDLPRNTLRPRLPNEPDGIPNAHGLNQLAIVRTVSAALPPCEIVFWQAGSGFAATGRALNGSAIRFGRRYVPGAVGALPRRLARSPVTCRLNGAPERACMMKFVCQFPRIHDAGPLLNQRLPLPVGSS